MASVGCRRDPRRSSRKRLFIEVHTRDSLVERCTYGQVELSRALSAYLVYPIAMWVSDCPGDFEVNCAMRIVKYREVEHLKIAILLQL